MFVGFPAIPLEKVSRNKLQQEKLRNGKSATGEECKTKTLQHVKMQQEIVQYKKRVQNEKKFNIEMLQYEKVQHEEKKLPH